jgi:phosphatidylglycerophosphatase A
MSDRRTGFALVTTFGLGYMRPAPGTWGSMPPVLLAGALLAAGTGPREMPWLYNSVMAGVAVAFSLACVTMGDHAEARFLRKDPSNVVADETAGQAIALLALPGCGVLTGPRAAITLLAAFLAFRLMDILKPPPARGIQRMPGGWGILLDDLVAGVYALVIVQVGAALAFGAVG